MNPRLIADLKRKMNRPLDDLPKFRKGEVVRVTNDKRHPFAVVLGKPKVRGKRKYPTMKVGKMREPDSGVVLIRYVKPDNLEHLA